MDRGAHAPAVTSPGMVRWTAGGGSGSGSGGMWTETETHACWRVLVKGVGDCYGGPRMALNCLVDVVARRHMHDGWPA